MGADTRISPSNAYLQLKVTITDCRVVLTSLIAPCFRK